VVALGTGCLDVYKHAYLMDPSPPTFGSEVAPNPLRFPVDVADAATPLPDALSIRVRRQGGAELLAWTPVATAGLQGMPGVRRHAIDMLRSGPSGVPALGTEDGTIELAIRATDWAGRETEAAACWIHHPLAAPIDVGAASTTVPSLLSWLLPAATASIAATIDGAGDGSLFQVPITQYTAEPIIVEVGLTTPHIVQDIAWVDDTIQTGTSSSSLDCGYQCEPGGPGCDETYPLDPACEGTGETGPDPAPLTGQALSLVWGVSVTPSGGGTTISCTGTPARCVIPARATGDAQPVAYVVVPRLISAPLTPGIPTGFGSHTLLGSAFVGKLLGTGMGCLAFDTTQVGVRTRYVCRTMAAYTRFLGLDRWRLVNNHILGANLRVSLGTTAGDAAAVRALPGLWSSGDWTWDAGNADLPGSEH
jgi:hypothetical protein